MNIRRGITSAAQGTISAYPAASSRIYLRVATAIAWHTGCCNDGRKC